jgi:hypothetical protein
MSGFLVKNTIYDPSAFHSGQTVRCSGTIQMRRLLPNVLALQR